MKLPLEQGSGGETFLSKGLPVRSPCERAIPTKVGPKMGAHSHQDPFQNYLESPSDDPFLNFG